MGQPVLTVKETWLGRFFSKDNGRDEMTLRVYLDRVECDRPGAIRKGTTSTVRYDSIAQVILDEGIFWSGLRVETRGGGGILIGGLPKEAARQAKGEIDERVAGA